VYLYRGLLALGADAPAEAVPALERARGLDPEAVEPVASFYLAQALQATRQREAAIDALEVVVRDWPGTPWA